MKVILFLLTMILFVSCTDFIADLDREEDWRTASSGSVSVYYRPQNATAAPSPTAAQAQKIAENQAFYARVIQDSIQRQYEDDVLIYLYNTDEAEERIGTAGGGHSAPRYLAVYYTFIHNIAPYTDQYGVENPFVGAHELVHVITHHLLGNPGTKLLSEGYAVWLDGSYGRRDIDELIRVYRDDFSDYDFVLTPSELLSESVEIEKVYYPNAGVFTRFLVREFGIETVNSLFGAEPENFKREFEKRTGMDWHSLSKAYQDYIDSL